MNPVRLQIAQAARETDRHPSEGQIKAGNYRKGSFAWNGMQIVIENPQGSVRRGVDASGRAWETKMAHHYGYVRSSEGADGDPVDVFVGESPESERVFVVDQVDPETGAFDEHKVMVGFVSEHQARQAYLANYEPGWQGLGAVTEKDIEGFRSWLESGESLTALGIPADTPLDIDPDILFGTFRGKVIPFRCVGWDKDERPLIKADGGTGDIPPGAHWITVHPNGPGTKGSPVLIAPVTGQKGVARIIGGAKGKLNGLRLHGVKDKDTYEQESKERRQQQAAKEKARKAGLTSEQKTQEKQAKEQAKGARREAEVAFIHKVMGHTGEAQALFEDGDNPDTPALSHREKLAKAKAVVKEARKRIMLDAESRVKAGVGQIGGGQATLDMDDVL
ncbi:MAG TPA: hypothetical protein VN436_01280, partial [Holophaga sp.]|nr:hypothetical protein [Holophaga sp.]